MYDLFRSDSAKEITLRPYQADAIEALRSAIREGKRRLVLCAGTGAGKTLTSGKLLQEADRKGSYSLFVVDRVALVDQTSAVFDEYGIQHGVVQGSHPRWAPRENVQVCSAQTLARRQLPRKPSLIVVDEAHCRHKGTIALMGENPDAVCIGLTATPFTKGMGNDWDSIVNVRSTRLLIEDGHLVEPTIYVARSPEDVELGLNSYGEFSDDSATSAGIKIIGDVVSEWERKVQEHFGGPVKTIVFSPTVEHGRELCAAFAAAGHNFQQISYMDRSDEERAERIAEFRRPDSVITGLVSCGVLTKGFDVPDCLVGISCKPYRKSLSSHMQEIGRVMRSAPGKDKALWLCHSGNVERFAGDMFDVWANGAGELDTAEKRDSKARERNQQTREAAVCPECSGAMRGPVCICCGWERPARSGIVSVDGELQAFDASKFTLTARDGLRAECLGDPRKVWDAIIAYCFDNARGDESKTRRWGYGIWRGIYPDAKLPRGWFDAARPALVDMSAYSLVDREVKRFRKRGRAA
ncbi:DEAD/DEAH box helicase [Rhodobacter sp. NTK016B]|uniref:DEAD/DEAH box helicase n=1 Tax=Rhodobacter sp. NTK016B TaxID=2759676 RepID=UPI001A90B8E6|nr:DEAD/DEAH box helicase [Rhodobacter sp. NTK016B]MBN8292836.1 DEAD/DEAH box helicase [Rhodobacter sp. NTK016B]